MKITYEFVTGEVSKVEVDERLGGLLLDLDRQQYNNDHKETRRHVSLDGMDYEGELFVSAKDTEGEAVRREDMARLFSAMETLSPDQRELVEYYPPWEPPVSRLRAIRNGYFPPSEPPQHIVLPCIFDFIMDLLIVISGELQMQYHQIIYKEVFLCLRRQKSEAFSNFWEKI